MEREFLIDRQKQGIMIAKPARHLQRKALWYKNDRAETLDKYKRVVIEFKKGASLRRAAAIGECYLGTAQRVQVILGIVK